MRCFYCQTCEMFHARSWSIHCSRCGRPTVEYCLPIGPTAKLHAACQVCDGPVPRRARFCPACGEPAEAGRRTWAFAFPITKITLPAAGFWRPFTLPVTARVWIAAGHTMNAGRTAGTVYLGTLAAAIVTLAVLYAFATM